MTIVHEVVGYDPESDEMVFECEGPPECLHAAAQIAGVTSDDPGIVGSYPLDRWQARDILEMILKRQTVLPEARFFLEPFACGDEPGKPNLRR